VVQPRCEPRLVGQRGEVDAGARALDHHEPIKVELTREEDLAHAATADRSHDLVATIDQLANVHPQLA
jgi:hypothetical protein